MGTQKIFVIPDTQLRPGDPFELLRWAGEHVVAKKPDVIVQIGDWADMPSLSSYDKGKKAFEGRRYLADINAANQAMNVFMSPIYEFNDKQKANGKKQYRPRKIMTLGNHCNRINKAVEDDSKLEG